jgi:hypothetical protein
MSGSPQLNWRAAAGLHAAISREITAIEGEIKSLEGLLKDPGTARDYWSNQIIEAREAIDQLKGIAAKMNRIKWTEIARTKGRTTEDAAARNADPVN